jgi:hypothetical protein
MKKIMLASLFIFSNYFTFSQVKKIKEKDLKKLVQIMAGEFSSEEQSKSDTDYFNIKLRMKPIWTNSTDGYWLYVEQAIATAELKPYRQRVYHVYMQDDTTVVSKVYELKTPKIYAGGWKDMVMLQPLTKDSLVDRQGCAIYLHKIGKTFTGSTPGKECLSTLRGAAYATSEVTIDKDKIISWDRGWDKEEKQMWGAEKGGYVFVRLKSL